MRLQGGVLEALLYGIGFLVAQREQSFRTTGLFGAVGQRGRADWNVLDVVHVDACLGRRRGCAAHIVRNDHLDARRGVRKFHRFGIVHRVEFLVRSGLFQRFGLTLHAEQLYLHDAGLQFDADLDGLLLVLIGRDRRLGKGHGGRRNGLVLDRHRLDAHLSVIVDGLDLEALVEFGKLDHFVERP